MARALGIISKDVYYELEKIRKIRNAFAHSPLLLHLGSAPIAPLFASLKRPGSRVTRPALVFLECVRAIDNALDDYIHSFERPRLSLDRRVEWFTAA